MRKRQTCQSKAYFLQTERKQLKSKKKHPTRFNHCLCTILQSLHSIETCRKNRQIYEKYIKYIQAKCVLSVVIKIPDLIGAKMKYCITRLLLWSCTITTPLDHFNFSVYTQASKQNPIKWLNRKSGKCYI